MFNRYLNNKKKKRTLKYKFWIKVCGFKRFELEYRFSKLGKELFDIK